MVAVVEAQVGHAMVMEPVLELQEEKRSPEEAVAEMEGDDPAAYDCIPEGLVVPAPDGLTAKVTE